MMGNLKKHILGIFLLTVTIIHAQACYAEETTIACQEHAEVMLKKMSDNLISKMNERLASNVINQAWIVETVETELLPYIDEKKLSQLVLGRYWREADELQRKEFYKVFYKMLIKSYASLFDFTGKSIKLKVYFLPVRDREGKYQQVSSIIKLANGSMHDVTYHVICRAGVWQVYDISIDGVVMSQSYHAQFESDLNKGGINELIRRIQQPAS